MEIVKSNAATLSNYEVMSHLYKIKDSKKKQKGQLATITYETLRYLENTPCKYQNDNTIRNYLKELEEFNLNKTEKLMLINFPPTTALEIQLIVEESEERLTDEQVDKLLEIITKYAPHIVKTEEQEEDTSAD